MIVVGGLGFVQRDIYIDLHHDYSYHCGLFQSEKSKALKCGTFAASSLQQRYLATGDFDGRMQIW